ncbi:MAG TPA: hypothetical protein VGC55_17780, partial [Dokdonella sp.]
DGGIADAASSPRALIIEVRVIEKKPDRPLDLPQRGWCGRREQFAGVGSASSVGCEKGRDGFSGGSGGGFYG